MLLISLHSFAQKKTGTLHISGAIRVEKGDATGAVVTVKNLTTKKVEDSIKVVLGGRFDFYLSYFMEYSMEVVKEGHYTKLIDVTTSVPSQVWAKDSIFPPFEIRVLLYRIVPKVKMSFEGKSIGKISYSPTGKLDNFDAKIFISDKDIRNEIDQALKTQEDEIFNRLLSEAADFEKKNMIKEAIKTYEEALALRKNDQYVKPKIKELYDDLKGLEKDALLEGEFRKLLQQGDENVEKIKFANAVDNYKAALSIKPGDKIASDKLTNAQRLLDGENAEKAKRDAEFDRLLAVGNTNISKQQFAEAIDALKMALKIKPENSVATARLAYAEQMFARSNADKAQLENRFNSLLAAGDENVTGQKYEEAIGNFNGALNLKPGNPEATMKLANAEKLLGNVRLSKAKLEEEFNRMVRSGDSAVSVQKYSDAIVRYQDALKIKSEDKIVVVKLSNAQQLLAKQLADKEKQEAEFNRLLAAGDENVTAQKYAEAIVSFKGALGIKPGEKNASAKLANAELLLARVNADKVKQEAEFERLLAEGDKEVLNQKYPEGIRNFKDALTIKPGNAVALDKLKRAEQLLAKANADKEKLEAEFNRLLAAGDENVAGQKYTEAIGNFKNALVIREGDITASAKLANAEQLLARVNADKAKQEAEFERLLAAGDLEVTNQKYPEGILNFKDALKIKPGDAKAVRKLNEAEQLLAKVNADKAKLEVEFNRLLAAGDADVSAQRYTEAIGNFKGALVIKVGDKAATAKLANAEQQLARVNADKAKQEAEFERLLVAGDLEVTNQKYPEGILNFKDALKIKPGNVVAIGKINEAERLLAKMNIEKAKLENEFMHMMAAGEGNVFKQKYTDAIDNFKRALVIKPGDNTATMKLANAEQLLAKQIADRERLESEFNRFISQGDGNVADKKYSEAITNFKEALKLKTGDIVAISKLQEAEKLLAQFNIEKQKAEAEQRLLADKQKRYKETIAKADQRFAAKSLTEAKGLYSDAIRILDTDNYPKEKIAEIDSLLAKQAADKLLAKKQAEEERKLQGEGSYLKNIEAGDANFAKSLWTAAVFYYQEALKFKASDKYATEKIDNCNKMIDGKITSERMQEYASFVKSADADLQAKKYSSARFYYGKANGILPWENYPKSQLAIVNKLIESTDVNGTEAQYFDAIKKADDAVVLKNIAIARFYYQKAITLKPEEEYPKQQLKRLASE